MLTRLQIRNFRGFGALEIDHLSAINLIAGKNNSGKTSLLEAVFLLSGAGNTQLAMNDNGIRDLAPHGVSTGDPFWKQLFFNRDMGRSIEITARRSTRVLLTLKITSERQPTTEIPLDRTNGTSTTNFLNEQLLAFEYTGPSANSVKSQIRMKEQGFQVDQPPTSPPFQAIILASRNRNVHEDAVRLGRLRQQERGDMLLKALRVFEPRLLSIEDKSSGGSPMIWGDIGWSELVPLSVMGEGMTQVARLVLSIASVPDGVVLIDELENGIHHTALPDVWRVIDEAARQFRTQIFATTHSMECIVAAHDSLSNDRFRLHRLEIAEKTSRCITYEPDAIDSAIRNNLEVR